MVGFASILLNYVGFYKSFYHIVTNYCAGILFQIVSKWLTIPSSPSAPKPDL